MKIWTGAKGIDARPRPAMMFVISLYVLYIFILLYYKQTLYRGLINVNVLSIYIYIL